VVAIGEIGLAGELRRVRDLPQRLAEAARLGFKYALVPADRPPARPAGCAWSTVDGMRRP
jgi:DNA repair protein RadA/Sms